MPEAVLCVLPLNRRLSLAKLRSALEVVAPPISQGMRPEGLASPERAEAITGCPMGRVPPVCIEPPLPTVVDASLFAAGSSQVLVAGSGFPDLKLIIRASELLRNDLAAVADILEEERPPEKPREADEESWEAVADGAQGAAAPLFPLRGATGSALHIVAVVAAVRRVAKKLMFADLVPAGTALPLESPRDMLSKALWQCPRGTGRPVRLQLIIGRSLAERLGDGGVAAAIKRVRPGQLLYVAGRLSVEELGEQTGGMASLPTEVKMIRERQLDNDIFDVVAEQMRVLEEFHLVSYAAGSARPAGMKKLPKSGLLDSEEPLDFALAEKAVHFVDGEEGLQQLRGILQKRLEGSDDFRGAEAEEATPLLPIMGLDAEWRPGAAEGGVPVALLQIAFRRCVFLLDVLTLHRRPALRAQLAELLRDALEAPQLFKVGYGLTVDLQRLAAMLPEAFDPAGARSVLDLQALAAAALPERQIPAGLSSLCRAVLGRGLDKTEQVSDWEARPLRAPQLCYAAQDAHVCTRLFDALCYRHATLAMQPLKPTLHGLAVDWLPGTPKASACGPDASASGPASAAPLRLDLDGCAEAWREAAGRRMQGGLAECARWVAGLPGSTHLELPWAEEQEPGEEPRRRICRFANSACLFLREDEDPGPDLRPPDAERLAGLPGPLAVFVQRAGGWHCAGRGLLAGGGAGRSPRLELLDVHALAASRLQRWAAAWADTGAP